MMVSDSITINAPRERVFEVCSDIRNAPSRIPEITRVDVLGDGPIGKGTRWRETRIMFGKEHTELLEIADFRAPEFYAVTAHNCGTDYYTTFDFRPEGPDMTTVTFAFEGVPTTFIAKLAGAIMAPMMKRALMKCIASDLANLKRACEAREDESRA
ncbi:MAG: SRPBCC family protein [Phycisphaeraceae bacterium]|nr:SRPBCC family protein [Phycisphaeraceae bacterium]